MSLGQKMADLRKKKKLSQNELGKRVQTSGDIIGRYERGEVKPSVEVVTKIANTLEVSLDYLVGKTDTKLDAKIVQKIVQIQSLPAQDQSHLFYLVDNILQNVKAKQAFAQ